MYSRVHYCEYVAYTITKYIHFSLFYSHNERSPSSAKRRGETGRPFGPPSLLTPKADGDYSPFLPALRTLAKAYRTSTKPTRRAARSGSELESV